MSKTRKAPALLAAALLLVPLLLFGQAYPQTYYLTGLTREASGGQSGGPDWGSIDTYNYVCADANPLLIIEINRHHEGWMDGIGYSDFTETQPFAGQLELYSDYYVIRSPLTLEPNIEPARTRKMDYQGYCLEDDWYGYGTGHYHAWHFYNGEMKLVRTVIKEEINPTRWYDSAFTLDAEGRRVEELTLVSPDSLNWVNSNRGQYVYTGEQFSPGHQFEKHSSLVPFYILRNCTGSVAYLNDNWIISHVVRQDANPAGEWYQPDTWYYNTEVYDGYVIVSSLGGTNRFNPEGLLTYIESLDGDGIPGYSFCYAHTSDTAADEGLLPSAPGLRVWPNPVRDEATLRIGDKASGLVTLRTYNIRGQLVKEDVLSLAAGKTLPWQAQDGRGNPLPNGIYVIRATAPGWTAAARVMSVK